MSLSKALVKNRPFVGGDRFITLFADASWCPNTKAFGWAFWVKHGDPAITVVRHGGGNDMPSSHLAEVYALEQGLDFIENELELRGKHIVVQSDCTGALASVLMRVTMLTDVASHGAARAYTKHVKGHQGHVTPRNSVNTTCDMWARRHMKAYRNIATSCKKAATE